MDWSLLACGARGHVTYAPDEPAARARLTSSTAAGETWRCLRCGTFVPGAPGAGGPAAAAPRVRRGKELRSALILRFFAVERFARAVIFALLAYALWQFKTSRVPIEQEYHQDLLPVLRTLLTELGYNVHHSHLLGLIQHAFTLNARTLTWLAAAALGYALIEVLEGVGLWLLKRWGEYFAMIATSVGIPYEIYDLTAKITALRVVAFVLNVALVVYLVVTKRLFGVRGGKHAYEARLRSESVMFGTGTGDGSPAWAAATGGNGTSPRPAGDAPGGQPPGARPAATPPPPGTRPAATPPPPGTRPAATPPPPGTRPAATPPPPGDTA
jgi:uncharacterized membrane protein (DUF2068 family)